jgi:cytochrome c oxidase cbb3-type subunit 2
MKAVFKPMFAIFGGALGIYIVIVLLIAVGPAIDLSKTPPGPGVQPLTPLQAEGRAVFAGNGCGYCHTQQVRPLPEDKVFGRPSAPGDFAYQTPELLGSERTGPDLTNVGNAKPSDVWQYIHLYDPRAVVPQSIMPDFKFLFQVVATVPPGETPVPIPAQFAPAHGKVIPTQKAKALVAYLLSLKQAPIPGYAMNGGMGGPASAAPASASASAPASAPASGGYRYDAAKGKALFTANCSACHQTTGEGIPGAFPPLKGNAAVDNADPTVHLHTILHGAQGVTIGGVKYSSQMPPFAGQLSNADIADIANYERSSWGNHAQHVTPAEVAAVRAKGN